MRLVDEVNQDDIGRMLGYYIYTDAKVWMEDGKAHRTDGPAVITVDGIERWYIQGKEITIEVRDFLIAHKWSSKRGLDTPEKLAAFQATFCK
jgi:hypothetical protein